MSTGGLLLVLERTRRHTPAMQRAFDLAQRLRLPVHVLLEAFDPVVQQAEDEFGGEAGRARRRLLLDGRRWLDALVKAWSADGLRVSGEVVWSPTTYRSIVEYALARRPVYVVKDSAPVTGARRLLHPVLGGKLIRYCPAPLMLVHPGSQHLPERLLAAVDATGSRTGLSDAVTRESRRLGQELGAEVHLAHAFASKPPYGFLRDSYARMQQRELETFGRFADRHSIPLNARHFLAGTPASALARIIAALATDLVVLGSAQRNALDHFLVGSTAASLTRTMPCDLLILKPRGFAASVARQLRLPRGARRR